MVARAHHCTIRCLLRFWFCSCLWDDPLTDLRRALWLQVTLPKLNTPEFFARMLLLYADLDWTKVRNWKDLRIDPETGDVLTFAAMAKQCGLLLDHKTAEMTLNQARTEKLLTPYRARILFCQVHSSRIQLGLAARPPVVH